MFKRYFTPNEARELFPLIKRIVLKILAQGQELRKIAQGHSADHLPPEALQLGQEIEMLMNELEEMGCYFKDWNFEIGLVDFPAIIDDEEVLLCWRSDEMDIGWYHTIEDGYIGRKPLPMEWLVT